MVRRLRPEFADMPDILLRPLKKYPKSYLNHSKSSQNRDKHFFEEDEGMFFNQSFLDSFFHRNIVSSNGTRHQQFYEPHSPKHSYSRRSLLDSSDVTVIPITFVKSPTKNARDKSNSPKTTTIPLRSETPIVIDDADRDVSRSDSPIIIDDHTSNSALLSSKERVSKKNNTASPRAYSPTVVVDNISPLMEISEINCLSSSKPFTDYEKSDSPSLAKTSSNCFNKRDIKDPSLTKEDLNFNDIVEELRQCESKFNKKESVGAISKCAKLIPSYPIYAILLNELAKEDRQVEYVRGDGNCFFRALSRLMYGTDDYHKAVRCLIVDIIATNREKFSQFVDGEDVQEHVERMSEDHCWATTCEIYAAATLLQRDIYMYTPNHSDKYLWLLFQPVFSRQLQDMELKSQPCCYVTLCNTNGNHYDLIVPNHGGCNCFLPLPQLDGIHASVDLTESDAIVDLTKPER